MDLYLPTSLNVPNMEEDSEVEQEDWDYEWEENEFEDQFSCVQFLRSFVLDWFIFLSVYIGLQ